MYLLDTNLISETRRIPKINAGVAKWLKQTPKESLYTCGWCPKMYADKRRANKKQRRHGIFELCKFKLPFAVPVAVDRI